MLNRLVRSRDLILIEYSLANLYQIKFMNLWRVIFQKVYQISKDSKLFFNLVLLIMFNIP